MTGNTRAPKKRLGPLARHLIWQSLLGYEDLFARYNFAEELACTDEEDFETNRDGARILRKLITESFWSDGEPKGTYKRSALRRQWEADDHTELCTTLVVLSERDLALREALKCVDIDDDDLADALWEEVNMLLGANTLEQQNALADVAMGREPRVRGADGGAVFPFRVV